MVVYIKYVPPVPQAQLPITVSDLVVSWDPSALWTDATVKRWFHRIRMVSNLFRIPANSSSQAHHHQSGGGFDRTTSLLFRPLIEASKWWWSSQPPPQEWQWPNELVRPLNHDLWPWGQIVRMGIGKVPDYHTKMGGWTMILMILPAFLFWIFEWWKLIFHLHARFECSLARFRRRLVSKCTGAGKLCFGLVWVFGV